MGIEGLLVGSGVEGYAFCFGGLHEGFSFMARELCSKVQKFHGVFLCFAVSCLGWERVGRFFIFYFLLIPFLFFY